MKKLFKPVVNEFIFERLHNEKGGLGEPPFVVEVKEFTEDMNLGIGWGVFIYHTNNLDGDQMVLGYDSKSVAETDRDKWDKFLNKTFHPLPPTTVALTPPDNILNENFRQTPDTAVAKSS
jgi:hypothetical protein